MVTFRSPSQCGRLNTQVLAFRSLLSRRLYDFWLLLPTVGVNTCDIITLYISAIKALRVLDPSMVILEVACEPIRRYLR